MFSVALKIFVANVLSQGGWQTVLYMGSSITKATITQFFSIETDN